MSRVKSILCLLTLHNFKNGGWDLSGNNFYTCIWCKKRLIWYRGHSLNNKIRGEFMYPHDELCTDNWKAGRSCIHQQEAEFKATGKDRRIRTDRRKADRRTQEV